MFKLISLKYKYIKKIKRLSAAVVISSLRVKAKITKKKNLLIRLVSGLMSIL